MSMEKEYSWVKGLTKSVVAVLLVGLPMLVQVMPSEYANLTIGGLAVLLVNYLKVKYQS